MIKAVIFDLDQTLLDRTATFQLFLERQYARFAEELAPVSMADFVSTMMRYDNNGYTPKSEVYAQLCNTWSLAIQGELFADFLEHYGQEPILFDGTLAVLELLAKSYPLGLITNGQN